MITRKSLADIIDAYDDQISELNKSKRETFDAYRDQMIAERRTKPEIKIEIEAVKAAIKRRREAAKDEHALIEKDELIDEVFHEITRAPRATRENIEEFDAETGEVRDTASPRKAAEAVAEMPRNNPVANVEEEATGAIAAASNDLASRTDEGGERQHSSTVGFTGDCRTEGKEQSDASAASVGDAAADAHGIPATISPEQATEKDASTDGVTNPSIDSAETGILAEDTRSDANTGGSNVTAQPAAQTHQGRGLVSTPPTRHPILAIRPHCQRPGEETCGGSGRNHCRACAAAQSEGEAA